MGTGLATLDSREAAHAWLLLRQVRRLVGDSRKARPGDAFVAWPGHASDGRVHVPDAIRAGAVACLVEAEGAAGMGFDGEPRIAALRGLKAAAGDIASRFLGHPSDKLDVVAVMVDEPTAGKWYGGDVAAPVFSEVVQQTLRMMGVQPDLDVKPQIVSRDVPAEKESF